MLTVKCLFALFLETAELRRELLCVCVAVIKHQDASVPLHTYECRFDQSKEIVMQGYYFLGII